MNGIATGHQRVALDEKNRVRIPSKFSDVLGTVVYIAPSIGGRLNVMSEEMFIKKHNFLFDAPLYDRKKTDSKSALLAMTVKQRVDAQGRIALDDAVMKKFNIKREVEFVGMFDYLELWPTDRYDEREELLDADRIGSLLEELSAAVGE